MRHLRDNEGLSIAFCLSMASELIQRLTVCMLACSSCGVHEALRSCMSFCKDFVISVDESLDVFL